MKISIDFGRPYFDEKAVFELTPDDLNDFYGEENAVNQLNLFFVLEASLHMLQSENRLKAAARCAFLMAYYLYIALTPPASWELAKYYINRAVELDETPEYSQWKKLIDEGN